MDKLTGIQFLNVLRNKPLTILTTAYDQYAIQGYELDIVDYLLKPISFERFVKAVEKAHVLINHKAEIRELKEEVAGDDYIFIKILDV